MIKSRNPNRVLILAAYICMLATFVTGILWIVAVVIAWQLKRNTEEQAVLAHCQWILWSNTIFISGVLLSTVLILMSLHVLPPDSTAALVVLLAGITVSFIVPAWYIYRTVRGFANLFRGPTSLPAA